jgi:PAS domain S-box-containing protein
LAKALTSEPDLSTILAAALRQSTLSSCITDAQLELPGPTIVFVNDAYCTLMNAPRDAVIGKTPRMMQGALTDRAVLDRLTATLAAGETFEGETVNYRSDGRPFINNWRIDPIRNDDGTITHFAAAQQDVTALRTFEAASTASRVVDQASRSALAVTDQPAAALALLAAGIHEATQLVLFGYGQVHVSISHPFGADAVAGQEVEPVRDIELAIETSSIGGHIRIAMSEAEAAIVDDSALEVVEVRASSAITMLVAAIVDRQMVGEFESQLGGLKSETTDGFRIAVRHEPSFDSMEISGDWLDVVEGASGTTFVIGDVAGHGVEAVVGMARLRSAVQVVFAGGASMREGIIDLTRFCFDHSIFSTLLVARPSPGGFEIVSAGHLPPVLVSAGEAALVGITPGPALGSVPSVDYPVTTVAAGPGAVLAMFTDGLVESRDESIDVGLEDIRRLLSEGSDDLEVLADEVMGMQRDKSLPDDTSLMLVEISPRR